MHCHQRGCVHNWVETTVPGNEERVMDDIAAGKVLPVANLTEFFRDALDDALSHQHLSLDSQSAHYVVNLLTLFARAEHSHAELKPGQRWVCLADLLAAASSAPTRVER